MSEIVILQLTPKKGYITPIKAHQLLSHLAYLVSLYHNPSKFKTYLTAWSLKPIFVASDAFPFGFLPKPLYPLNLKKEVLKLETEEELKNLYAKYRKPLKNANFIKYSHLTKWVQGNMSEQDLEEIINLSTENQIHKVNYDHNVINRIFNKPTEDVGGVYRHSYFYSSKLWIIFKIITPQLWEEFHLKELVTELFTKWGYGKRKSIGYGLFRAEWINPETLDDFPPKEHFSANTNDTIMFLADCIPKHRYLDINYFLSIKTPRYALDNQLESGIYFKNPIIYLSAGSVGRIKESRVEYEGTILENKINHPQAPPSYEFAFGLILKLPVND